MFIDKVFKGIRSCLNVDENEEDVLMRTNQILYDLMPEILKYPVELQPEMSTLIPALVENLGNPKVSSAPLNLVGKCAQANSQSNRHLRKAIQEVGARITTSYKARPRKHPKPTH